MIRVNGTELKSRKMNALIRGARRVWPASLAVTVLAVIALAGGLLDPSNGTHPAAEKARSMLVATERAVMVDGYR
ncbi:MAG: hypothetical protein AAFU85_34345, partial [Planctomycetota bacterium]